MSLPLDDLRGACRRAQLVGAALALAVVVYAVVVERFVRAPTPFRGFAPDVPVGLLRLAMVAVAVANVVVGRVLRHKLGAAVTITPTRDASPVSQRLFIQSVIELALGEAIAIYGFVLFLVGGQPLDFYAHPIRRAHRRRARARRERVVAPGASG